MRVRDSEDMSTTTAVSNADGRDDGTATFAGLCAALDLLDAGVLLLSSDLRVTYANARWTRWVGTPLVAGTPLAALVEEAARDRLSLLVDTLADGQPRTLQLWLCPVRADAPSHHLTCTARRTAMHGLVLEALPDDDDASSLHDVARRLAEVSDMAEVLHTLCEIAAMRCRGTAAAVLRTTGQLSEVVAASGDLLPARGRCFELDGSMVQEAFEQNTIVSESN